MKEKNKKQKEIEKNQSLKVQGKNNRIEIQNQLYYYQCYLDNQKFYNEKEYVEHFLKSHKNDFPFYCDICNRGFWSYLSIESHSRAKGHHK